MSLTGEDVSQHPTSSEDHTVSVRRRVLYLAGAPRSGSTLLARILGQAEGFFNAGEIMDIWDRGLLNEGTCSCGRLFGDCSVWQRILANTFGSDEIIPAKELTSLRDRAAHSRTAIATWVREKLRLSPDETIREYGDLLGRLYRAVFETTECDVLVDASKNLGYAMVLANNPEVELYLVHLVRDPRATAFSWQREKEGLRRHPVWSTCILWDEKNLVAEWLGRIGRCEYLMVRYEDFATDPEAELRRIMAFVEAKDVLPEVGSPGVVHLRQDHAVYGNPNRFVSGPVPIRLDNEWKHRFPRADRRRATLLTWPLILRYGYRLRPQGRSPA